MKRKYLLVMIVGSILVLFSCSKDNGPSGPTGSIPAVTTEAASNVGATSATLHGTVNPNGLSTTVIFQYGTTPSYGEEVTAIESPVAGTSPIAVTAEITNLSPGMTYHSRVVGINDEGTSNGEDKTFLTGSVPAVTTEAASNVGATSATLHGTVNPNGLSTTVVFQYGTTPSYGEEVTAIESPVAGTSPIAVTAELTNLSPGMTYHSRVVGTNDEGASNGEDKTFTTESGGQWLLYHDPYNAAVRLNLSVKYYCVRFAKPAEWEVVTVDSLKIVWDSSAGKTVQVCFWDNYTFDGSDFWPSDPPLAGDTKTIYQSSGSWNSNKWDISSFGWETNEEEFFVGFEQISSASILCSDGLQSVGRSYRRYAGGDWAKEWGMMGNYFISVYVKKSP